jgi:pimeloyl-ACP methyl ester carboxylesterase
MHDLFQAARLKQPYVLVGASAGGVLVRRYQQEYLHKVAGLFFVDSAHEEMAWRNAAISKQFDPNWNSPVSLQENGFLPCKEKLAWHADIHLIVLERSERAPCSAFPGKDQQQCGAINDEWHTFDQNAGNFPKICCLRDISRDTPPPEHYFGLR